MKPISFENIRRLMGSSRKNTEKESSFKRSDSFKRISIRKNYLDRGGKKKQKNDLANVQIFKEESKLEEYHITPSDADRRKNEKESKVENIYMKAPQFYFKSTKNYDKLKEEFSERSSVAKNGGDGRHTRSREVCTQTDEVTETDVSPASTLLLCEPDNSHKEPLITIENDPPPCNANNPKPKISRECENITAINKLKEQSPPESSFLAKKLNFENKVTYKRFFNYSSAKKVPEKIIIHVPASEEISKSYPTLKNSPSVTRRFGFSESSTLTHDVFSNLSDDEGSSFLYPEPESHMKRQESDDSAIEIFPIRESPEIIKFDRSPIFAGRRNFRLASPPPSLIPDINFDLTRNDEMRSLSISLGRIWMDAPLTASIGPDPHDRLLQTPSPLNGHIHNSLDSSLKVNKDDHAVNSLDKKQCNVGNAYTPASRSLPSAKTGSVTTGKTQFCGSPDMFSSKDSGLSFTPITHILPDMLAETRPKSSGGGFFRKKKKVKPVPSVGKDGYFERVATATEKPGVSTKRLSGRSKKSNRGSIKSRRRQKKGTIKNDMYTVVVRRPPRLSKIDPVIFVPPEKRNSSVRREISLKYKTEEIRRHNSIADRDTVPLADSEDFDSEDGLYECISANFTEHSERAKNYKNISLNTKSYDSISGESSFRSASPSGCRLGLDDAGSSYLDVSCSSASGSLYVKNHGCHNMRSVYFLKNSDLFNTAVIAEDSSNCSESGDAEKQPYVPQGVSPVPGRRPARRKPRPVSYRAKPSLGRAPSKSGDITQKGYEKKRTRLIGPYIPKQAYPVVGGGGESGSGGGGGSGGGSGSNCGGGRVQPRARRAQRRVTHNEKRYHSGSARNVGAASGGGGSGSAQRYRGNRRLTRNESRYHSEVRQEAVQQALAAMQSRPKPSLPMPSKRTSVMADSPDRDRHDTASSSDDDSVANEIAGSIGSHQAPSQRAPALPPPFTAPSIATPSAHSDSSAGGSPPPPPPPPASQGPLRAPRRPPPPRGKHRDTTDTADVMSNLRPWGQGPDVTHTHTHTDRVNRCGRPGSDDNGTARWKVSAKIQQLLNTLKRPKRRPLPEFYEDDDIELEIAANPKDPNAPKPEGGVMTPAIGEQLVVPSGLPRNLEAAIQRYGSASFKASVATVLDPNGKMSNSLTYGKLLSRSQKISYALLNKTFWKGTETALKPGERIALVYPNNDPINFMCAWYGCLQAGIVPVAVEVPLTRRDAGSQQIGFLLGSTGIHVALTSDACYKGLPKSTTGEVVGFKGWPRLQWTVTEHLPRAPRDWLPPAMLSDDTPAYIEYTSDGDGSVMGVTVSRAAMLAHCRALTAACNYTEGENMVCVLDFKREVGLWHGVLTSVLNGMHVIFIPYALMKVNPASWMHMITKYRASIAVVKSRDLHWGLLATKDHKDISLHSLRLLLVADGANPWSLSSCDQFLSVFSAKGLRAESVCPCACGSEALTVSVRRAGRAGGSTGRGVLSMAGLSHGVVRVDQENSLTSLTLQDCGQVMPGSAIAVVRMDGPSYLCKTDEVGEICVMSGGTGNGYWGLQGLTTSVFGLRPLAADGNPIGDQTYTRTGLLGFLGPGGLVFICGSRDGLMTVTGRKHNMDDIIATVLAVEPMKFIYRGRIAVFSIRVLRDDRICVIAEQRPDCSEEESFQWMSRVLQAVDSIHQVGIYCLALVQPNYLPKTPLGGIHLSECKRRFLEGTLHPANVLLCPHTCVTNLPKPREIHSDVGPASVIVGNLVQGNRLASAHGRDMGHTDDSDAARKYQFISEILRWRAQSTSDHIIFTLLNSKGTVAKTLSCSELHKKAERIGNLLLEKGRVNTGEHVALIFPPGLELICAFYGCLYVGAVPVTIRPPHPQNLQTTLPTVRMIVDVSKSALVLSNQNVIKLLKSKEASNVVDIKSWPMTLDTDDMPKKKLPIMYRAPTAEMLAYLDFSVSTTGMLAGIKMSHAAVTSLCRSMKLACELYPSRHIALCLDPYCGLGFALWCLSSIYSGHHSILIPPSEVEINPALWLSAVSQYRVRDTFCSYGVMELCTKGLGSSVDQLKTRGVNLGCVRTCVAVAEERPRINLTASFSKLFSALGLSPRAVSTSFGCRVNIAICLQGASSPEPSTVYVDLRALRNDRVSLVERGSPHSLCVMESGKLLPGVKVIIANPETKGQCGDSHLGEVWVQSSHNASGYFTIYGDESDYADHFNARLVTGSTGEVYARTGYLGFLRRTEGAPRSTGDEINREGRDSDPEGTSDAADQQDAVFVVGALDETVIMRGMRYHPIDIENSVMRCHKKIAECAVFTWTNLLVVVAELDGSDSEALNLVPLVTNAVLEEHHLVVGVVVVVDPGVVPINSRGEKQRMHLRDGFLSDQIDAIYIAYNM